ncbi:cell cycle checkpoint protein RAD17 isoform X1 [Lycium barbarum]|uniref:cell cycle checkpoint protein RAD17 isoform X1 n=2 Tax=Lycium barbarum TaxID=112863 RepID=UPI00293F0B51|nr:cell cycle checkpoint protein RAD17 isoform X1 [Lycium barbarum]
MKKSKRNAAIVVLSSDDDDEDLSLKSNFTQPKSKSVSVPRKNPKRVKTVSLSASCPRSSKDGSVFDEMKRFCEEFDDDFTGIKVSAGLGSNNDMWVDKHKPHFLEELAVHKKKVEEVKTWFEERLKAVTDDHNNVLLVAGPSGVGKTVTIHAIASHLGVTIFEWTTPTPTIWSEHLHNSNSGLQYRSKLDEFEGFVERVRKYGLACPTLKGSHASVILLIDDLPLVNGRAAYGRLQRCLKLLVQLVRIPTAIVITNYDKDDSADFSTGCWEELLLSLHSAGACKVNFNPVTVNSVKKTLTTICRKEKREFGADTIELIAKASGGDIRHAITSLQYLCLKPHRRPILPSKERLDNASYLDDVFCLPFGKDENLSLFHALGKFLHNKRESEHTTASDRDAFLLKEKFVRFPLKMDAPEVVLCQAHGQARTLSDFLHENVLDFLSEEAIDDAWLVASYLSDADFLLSSLNGHLSRDYGAENIIQSAAASVAARGVLFGNAHPVSSRWHAIRRPKLWEAEQSSRRNKCQMLSQRGDLYNSLTISDQIVMATEFRPVLKWLGYRASESFQADNMVEDDSDSTCLHENKLDISDDEIEDC